MNLRDLIYDNWKAVYAMPPGPEKEAELRILRLLVKGNLYWLIKRLIGGVPSDGQEFIDQSVAKGEMSPPDEFIRRRREDLKRQNKQHSKH